MKREKIILREILGEVWKKREEEDEEVKKMRERFMEREREGKIRRNKIRETKKSGTTKRYATAEQKEIDNKRRKKIKEGEENRDREWRKPLARRKRRACSECLLQYLILWMRHDDSRFSESLAM